MWRKYWSLLKDSINKFIEDDIFTWAAALAYYTIFSLPPMLLIITYTLTSFYSKQEVDAMIFGELGDLVGVDGAQQLSITLTKIGVFENEWWSTILGVGVLVFTATTVFVTIQNALNHIFRVKPKPKRGLIKLIKDRILSFTLVLGIAFILLVSLIVNALINALSNYIANHLPDVSMILLGAFAIIIPILITTLMFAMIFKFLPDARLQWKDVWLGSLITAILFSGGRYLIAYYIGQSNVANLYDAAGSILVMMVWIFYASLIFLFGAVYTYIYTKAHNRGIEPSSYAVRVVQKEIEIKPET